MVKIRRIMKKILLIFSAFFLFISCQCKSDDISINISYVGNYDFPTDIFLTNYEILKKIEVYQSVYEVNNSCVMIDVRNYIIKNHSREFSKFNKLKIIIAEKNIEKIYYFNADDGIKFINYLRKNVYIKKDNKYFNDQYFKNNLLSSLEYKLKNPF